MRRALSQTVSDLAKQFLPRYIVLWQQHGGSSVGSVPMSVDLRPYWVGKCNRCIHERLQQRFLRFR